MPAPIVSQSWLDLQPIGTVIEGTRFIPFKTPMSKQIFEINKIIGKEKYFTPKNIESTGKKLGIIVDLSSGTEYYNSSELKALGIEYVKLKTRKRTLIETRQKFNEAVKDFINKNSDQDYLIGVHCYHGLQRTAYMICSYMVTEMNIDLGSTIEAFEVARGHKIENAKKWLYDHSKNGFKP